MRNLGEGITALIGNTPLVHLTRAIEGEFHVFAKLEGMNPGGSIKDRPAFEIIRHGIEVGAIRETTVIVEATSGNMGIGLAQICRFLGLRFICVTDTKVTGQNLHLLKTYGAEVEVISEPDPVTGDLLQARINRARKITESLKDSFWVNQYSNPANARAHYRTMAEVMTALDGKVDYVFCAASSCGTLRGCADYLRMKHLCKTTLCAVDAPGSIIFGGTRGKRLIPGHGSSVRPALYQPLLADRCIKVTDQECVIGCRRLLETEGLLAGGSSGAVFMALQQIRHEILAGANCVLLFPDRGERYLDTIFSDQWIAQHWSKSCLEPQVEPQEAVI